MCEAAARGAGEGVRSAWGVIVCALAAAAFAIPAAAQPDAMLTDVRFWSSGDVTRVAIETSSAVDYRAERVDSPDRIFFDLAGTRRQPGRRGVATIPVNDPFLKQIRFAQMQPGIVRVVLDLQRPADYSVSQLSHPDRLIVELRPMEAAPGPAESSQPSPPQVSPRAQASKAPEVPDAAALASKRDSHGQRSLIRALGLKLQRVVLDPGHGGHDTGTIGRRGLVEKELVLDIAKRLGGLIEQRLGAEVVYTRTDDTFIPLEERTTLATAQEADLFLSIHANSSSASRIAGPETFYLNFTTDQSAMDVAARENATAGRTIKDYPDLVEKIALSEKVNESRELAGIIQQALYSGLMRGRRVANRGVKKAPFVVLIGAQIPSVLAEVAFLSNARDELLLKRPDYRQRVAEALFKGVSQYADALSRYTVARQNP